ncbi:DNA gyrase subunit B [Candidatus Riesia sp. GBBU]|nr:DNA gyrase subunit B [Candidatus Riesia sp. GBBU]
MKNNYNSSSIKVLKGLEAVQKRPGMYIGSTDDGSGLHQMVFEIVENSIDEALAGYCNKIIVTIHKDNSISVLDNGRGIPTEIHEEGISAAEVIMTFLHSGGKFDNNTYLMSSGLHGVGISVVNALSEMLELIIYRNGKIHKQIYKFGVPKTNLYVIGDTDKVGTYIRIWPNLEIFKNFTRFEYNILSKRFKELSFLNSNISIILNDQFNKKQENFHSSGGIKSFLKYIINDNEIINLNSFYFSENLNDIYVELSMQWTNNNQSKIYCFTNNVAQKDGGTHLSGLKTAITRTFRSYMEKAKYLLKNKIFIKSEDIREGIIAILSIRMLDPRFSSQTKDKLVSMKVKNVVESLVNEKLMDFLEENPLDAKILINKIINSAKSREEAKKIKQITKQKNETNIIGFSGKLADCQEKNPCFSELYLVEGDSAGGSAKQGRDRKNQAVLPLKGKILNIEKASFEKIISSKEITSLITVLGFEIGKDEYNFNKLRYHNIIIMTDADIDGSHIRTLLLTFFYRKIPEIIHKGYIYIANPPLYKIKKGKIEKYINDDNEMRKYLFSTAIKEASLYIKESNFSVLDGRNLYDLLIKYSKIKRISKRLRYYFPENLIKCLIYQSLLTKETLKKYEKTEKWISTFTNFLSLKEGHCGNYKYYIDINKKNGVFEPILIISKYGVEVSCKFGYDFINSMDYLEISQIIKSIGKTQYDNAYIRKGNKEKKINYFEEAFEWLLKESSKGLNIQRYKGLGEMNPEQLWETTMNPSTRKIKKITVKDASSADKLFKILMGESVELRRRFIEKNALLVENIDI